MQSNFAPLFNAVVLATAATLGLAAPAEAITIARSVPTFSRPSFTSPKPAYVAPKPITPAPKPAPVAAPKPAPAPEPMQSGKTSTNKVTSAAADTHETTSGGSGGNGRNGGIKKIGNDGNDNNGPKKPTQTHADEHTSSAFGYWYYNQLYSRPNVSHYHAPLQTGSSNDHVLNCMQNRMFENHVSRSEIQSQSYHINQLRQRFDAARLNENPVSISGMSAFDQKALKAYKDCTYDW